MKLAITSLVLVIALGFSIALATAHSGGTDRNGCHQDNRNGGRHCH